MNRKWIIAWLIFVPAFLHGQPFQISLEQVLNEWCLSSPSAKKIKLSYENTLLAFDNYKKQFLPSIAFSLNPVNFNRSQKLMQNAESGNYSYVEDYTNSSSTEIAIRQKIGIIGGELSVSSRLNYLREFSNHRDRFGTNPLYINYSQPFVGGFYNYKKQRDIQYAQLNNSIKQYCSEIANVQTQAVNLFMSLFSSKLSTELSYKNLQISDTLLTASKALLDNGYFTEYEYHQMELQQLNNQYAYESSTKSYQKALRELITFLNKSEWMDKEVEIQTPEFDLPLKIDEKLAIFYAWHNSPFALTQEEKRLKAEQTLFTAKLNNRFNGNLNLSYGLNQYSDHFLNAYRKPDYTQGIMIGIQIPIFQWGINRNKIRMAKNNYQHSMIEIDQAEANFDNDIQDIVEDYNHNMNLWFVATKSYQLSQEQYALLAQKFHSGKVSVYELASAQQEQYNAMQRYYNAIMNAWNSFCMLRKTTLYDFAKQTELEDLFF
ncbi:Outer membrane protein TolC [Bacteroides faecichinchillae]|uniref:Outer membrane protein TolC n=1 Tax=Bacteroides faecichinchillae TaxID=871325 RepID=A0A1M5DHL7_9BACE|nr:TolC family protein [Bacteroides faecichinchillae]THG62135.1 TolC family protein [Bacteroides faecichinchillae]SHF66374.1 Outer membrane protein TolC [Bacteroides faecichinchillae]